MEVLGLLDTPCNYLAHDTQSCPSFVLENLRRARSTPSQGTSHKCAFGNYHGSHHLRARARRNCDKNDITCKILWVTLPEAVSTMWIPPQRYSPNTSSQDHPTINIDEPSFLLVPHKHPRFIFSSKMNTSGRKGAVAVSAQRRQRRNQTRERRNTSPLGHCIGITADRRNYFGVWRSRKGVTLE